MRPSGKRLRRWLRALIIAAAVVVAGFYLCCILALAALSYLGLGLPNTTPTWGGMLSNGTTVIYDGYWWQLYPAGICIVLTVVAFNFMGDALRDSLDVRLQRR